ncbi:MAG TPA: lipid-A-disaccharide synthase N-terminal domain-containing protein [Planctomycetota bacterium]|nr:lipid-A-disaccharide synthase N-terminal domain-containing protein [Planctomycetota bacterium]
MGFAAQLLFTSRFLVQWIASERKGQSVIPMAFWYFSMSGSTLLLIYAIWRRDPVFILGQAFGCIVYVRNLMLIFRKPRAALGS